MSDGKFDIQKATEKYGKHYTFTEPDPKCDVCNGKGLRKQTICVGMDRYESETYCDCTISHMHLGGKR